ncbi:MAG: ROK family transcriptional regulator [Candidatus Omnitrophica bacterium]|nr:ROK family transcriptional regulator [Candidatus Omnitrophota bacterium]
MIKRRSLLDQHRLSEREEKNFQILELLRQRGPLTRTELSQGTGFNIVTVSNYINQFIKQGLVSERGFDVSTGGRKPILVELNAKAGFAVGIDLGPMDLAKSHTIATITDLHGQVVHRLVKQRTLESLDRVLQETEAIIRETLETSPVEAKKIRGIGIGLPGILDERAGTVRDTSRRGKRTNYVAFRDEWERIFGLPVLVGNDATLAGYGELRLGLDRPVQNLIYCYSDVGASLIFNGHIYWGSGGSAGELGLFVESEDDYLTWIKSPGFVLSNVWDLGVSTQAKKLIEQGDRTAIQELAHGKPENVTLDVVLQAAQQGDRLAQELIEHVATQLGIRIAYLVNLLNPEVVVVGGGIERAGSLLFEPVWRAVKKYGYEEPASLVDVLPAQLGENSVALGAACWVVREVFIQA